MVWVRQQASYHANMPLHLSIYDLVYPELKDILFLFSSCLLFSMRSASIQQTYDQTHIIIERMQAQTPLLPEHRIFLTH